MKTFLSCQSISWLGFSLAIAAIPLAHGAEPYASPKAAPRAFLSQPYYLELQVGGKDGARNSSWEITRGALPDGLTLDGGTGVIQGVATTLQAENAEICASFIWGGVEPSTACKTYSFESFTPSAGKLTHGPIVGGVTGTSAVVGFRVKPNADVAIEYSTSLDFANPSLTAAVATSMENDYTGKVALSGLTPGTSYYYRPIIDGVRSGTITATFNTFEAEPDEVRIAVMADFKRASVPAPALVEVRKDNPDVVLLIGDHDHSDPTTIHEMREMYQKWRKAQPAGADFRREILYRFPVDYTWDDHDYGPNDSNKYFVNRSSSLKVNEEYWPGYERESPANGIWHKFSIGNLVEVIVLDSRTQRDLQTYLDPRFIADDQPDSNRDFLRDDPDRSMLDGDASDGFPKGQKEWFKNALLNSTATWKLVASSVPWNPTTEKDDAWWDYRAERQEIMDFINEHNIRNVVFVSGDIHSGGGVDDGTNAGVAELSVARASRNSTDTNTCRLKGPNRESSCGTWSEGMAFDLAGYGLVLARQGILKLIARDDNGATVHSATLYAE